MPRKAEEFLFDFFTKAATEFFSDCDNVFICPLCLQIFDSLSHLSKAHLWPEALGGRIFTLACRECNSGIGSKIEKHEVQRVNYTGQSQIPFQQQIDGIEGITGGLLETKSIDGKPTVTMKMSNKFSNPETLIRQGEEFSKGVGEIRSTWIFPTGYNYQIALLTYLHFAYMTLFHLANYRWTKTLLAEHIRQQLKFPKKADFPVSLMPFDDHEANHSAEAVEPIIFEIMAPSQLRGFLVTTPALKHEGNQRLAIWIPKFFYSAHKIESLENWSGINFTYRFTAIVGRKPGRFLPERLLK